MAKYPFNPGAVKEASIDEMAAVFQPQTGALWTLYNEGASKLLERRGTEYVPKATESGSLSPGFVKFFNKAAGFSDALYREGALPRLSFTLKARFAKAISAATITIGSQTATFTQDAQDAKPFVWSGAAGDSAQLSVRIGNSDVTLLAFNGPWAAFKLFHAADRWRTSGNTLIGEWAFGTGGQQATVSGESSAVTFELNLGGAPPVVRRDYFDGFRRCIAAIAR
jgi:type VI protein secretion system component VasK